MANPCPAELLTEDAAHVVTAVYYCVLDPPHSRHRDSGGYEWTDGANRVLESERRAVVKRVRRELRRG